MRTSHILSALVLGVGIVAGGASLLPAFAQGAGTVAGAPAKNELTMGQIHDKVTAMGYQDIDKIERERNAFEVKARDKNGAKVKLYLDPQTGEVIDSSRKNDKRERRTRDDAGAGAGAPQ